MAYPVIIIQYGSGYDDQKYSGAGPGDGTTGGTAVTGADGAYCPHSSSTLISLPGKVTASTDLPNVLGNGSHAIFVNDTNAGNRNWGRITGVYDEVSFTCNTSVASPTTVTNCSRTDIATYSYVTISSAGAGGSALFTWVTAGSGGGKTITINDSVQDTLTGANAVRHFYVSCSEAFAVQSNVGWGIGGKLASLGHATSRKLVDNSATGDAMPGWTIQFNDGHYEENATAIYIRRAGDQTTGPITLRAQSGASTVPYIECTGNNVSIFQIAASYIVFDGIRFKHSGATHGVAMTATAHYVTVRNCYFDDQTKYLSRAYSAGSGHTFVFENNIVAYTSSKGVYSSIQSLPPLIRNNFFYGGSDNHIYANHGIITGNLFVNPAKSAIFISSSGGYHTLIQGNTIYNVANNYSGIDVALAYNNSYLFNFQIVNNIVHTASYGISFSGTSISTAALASFRVAILNNDLYNCTNQFYPTAGVSFGDVGTQNVDPGFSDPTTTYNFAVGTNLKELGYPTAVIPGTQTRSYVDIGVAQREEPATSGGGSSWFAGE